jgi:hypothetical protein
LITRFNAINAISRKIHGNAGPFDVGLPLTGKPGIECRSGGATSDYQIVVTFGTSVTFGGARVTTGTGSVSSTSMSGNQVFVNLTGVTNAQTIQVTLLAVNDGTATNNLNIPMSVLLGDVDATGRVDGNDVSAVQSHTRQTTDGTNYQYDVDVTGRIDGNDVSTTQAQTRTSLP